MNIFKLPKYKLNSRLNFSFITAIYLCKFVHVPFSLFICWTVCTDVKMCFVHITFSPIVSIKAIKLCLLGMLVIVIAYCTSSKYGYVICVLYMYMSRYPQCVGDIRSKHQNFKNRRKWKFSRINYLIINVECESDWLHVMANDRSQWFYFVI